MGCAAAASLGIYALWLCYIRPKPQGSSNDILPQKTGKEGSPSVKGPDEHGEVREKPQSHHGPIHGPVAPTQMLPYPGT